jgi:hypothetical protein
MNGGLLLKLKAFSAIGSGPCCFLLAPSASITTASKNGENRLIVTQKNTPSFCGEGVLNEYKP